MALYDHLTTARATALKAALNAAAITWQYASPCDVARHLRLQAHDHTGHLWVITPLTQPHVPAAHPTAIWSAHCPQTGNATAALTTSALTAHLRAPSACTQGELL